MVGTLTGDVAGVAKNDSAASVRSMTCSGLVSSRKVMSQDSERVLLEGIQIRWWEVL